jgi:hypothetical protein
MKGRIRFRVGSSTSASTATSLIGWLSRNDPRHSGAGQQAVKVPDWPRVEPLDTDACSGTVCAAGSGAVLRAVLRAVSLGTTARGMAGFGNRVIKCPPPSARAQYDCIYFCARAEESTLCIRTTKFVPPNIVGCTNYFSDSF